MSWAVLLLGLISATSGWFYPNPEIFEGPVSLLAIDRHNAARVYAAGNGVFRSDDFGTTWAVVDRDLHPRALHVDPSTRDRLYALAEGSIFGSSDSGETWSRIVSPGPPLYSFVVDAAGTLYGTAVEGSFRLQNGEAAWTPVLSVPNGGAANAADPSRPDVLYGVACPLYPGGGSFSCSLYKSVDGSRTWTELFQSGVFVSIVGVDFSLTRPGTAYAALYGRNLISSEGSILLSEDDGATWSRIFSTVKIGGAAVDPVRSDVLYVSSLPYPPLQTTVAVEEITPGGKRVLGRQEFAVTYLLAAPNGAVLYALDDARRVAVFQLHSPRSRLLDFR